MKVLIVYPFNPSLGASGRKEDAVRSFEAMHHHAGVEFERLYLEELLSDCDLSSWKSGIGASVVRHWARRKNTLLRSIAAAIITRTLVKAGKFDAIIIYGLTAPPIVAGVFIAKLNGIPYFIYEHRSYYAELRKNGRKPSRFIRIALPRARKVLCLTEGHRNDIMHYFPCLNPTILFIPPYDDIDMSILTFPDGRQGSFSFKVGAWANWREIKRLDLLINAFCKFAERKDDVKLRIAGPIPDNKTNRMALKQAAECLDLHKIEFLGPLGRKEIAALSCDCDAAAISSDYESFGLPAVEALVVGTPVVTTDCSGPPSFVDLGKNGFVVPTGDSQAMAHAFEAIYEKLLAFKREEIASAARAKFSIEGQAHDLAQIYGINSGSRS
jgi:glycosyltransferase involved in cell wall biosynthesis